MMFRVAYNYFFHLRSNQYANRKKIDEITWKKLIENVRYAYEHVPYYREQFKKAGITPDDIKTKNDFLKIPITTKKNITLSNLRYVSDEFKDEKLYTSRTSGSTGEPFVSYFDRRGWSILKFASKYRARSACGFSHKDRFVIIEAMPVEEADKFNSTFKLSGLFIKKKFLSVYDSLENHVAFYQEFKPTTLYGFASYLVNLISYLEKNSIKLDFIERIFTSSEVLSKSTRDLIENYFGCKVYDVYGSTEVKEVSWECEKQEGYHINEDLIYVECINDDGKPAKNGEVGKIVMTSLQNKAMPLLRYSIGDMGYISNKYCSCGRTFRLMKPTYGRIIDYFVLKNGKRLSPYELTMSVEGISGIVQYQILQKTKSRVEINIRKNEKFMRGSDKKVVSNLKKILGDDVEVVLNFVESFEMNNERRKFRVVMSEVKNDL